MMPCNAFTVAMIKQAITIVLLSSVVSVCARTGAARKTEPPVADTSAIAADVDSLDACLAEINRLTEEDYSEIAELLGVETAAIKAVVDIEAGKKHEGFIAPGQPLINFDLSMFRAHARRKGVNLLKFYRTHPVVFSSPDSRRFGSRQAAQHARLKAACTIDEYAALAGTFWGMFQIGGFNWKLCGCSDIHDFVNRMSRSEREQLLLFANFIKNVGLDKYLRAKNWSAFARRYNGSGYAARGYHTRMANAYARHVRLEKQQSAAKQKEQ